MRLIGLRTGGHRSIGTFEFRRRPVQVDMDQPLGRPVPDWHPPSKPSRDVMHGRYCRLEPLDPDRHAAQLYEANQEGPDTRLWTYLSYGPFIQFEDYRAWMEKVCMSDDPMFFAVVELKSGRACGVASYLRIQPERGSIEVGHINFAPALQRTRAGTEAMYLMMRWAFEQGYRRYEWKCDALNQRSRRAALRLGLSFEGVFRNAAVVKGRNRDTAWFAAVCEEWPALQVAFQGWLEPENFDERGEQVRPLLARPA